MAGAKEPDGYFFLKLSAPVCAVAAKARVDNHKKVNIYLNILPIQHLQDTAQIIF
jgi:hypothetical protein